MDGQVTVDTVQSAARASLRAGAGAVIVMLMAAVAVAPGAPARWRPQQHLTWYWQLTGRVNWSMPVMAYDVDGFDTTAAEVRALHRSGRRAICYIDVGTWENWRPDAGRFPPSLLGRSNGWPGERWLDIRRLSVLAPLMRARFRMCRRKGFDALEPDNMDGYANSTGFRLTARDQLRYDRWVAVTAHALGLAVFQKNNPGQASELEPYFDGALDEQCNQFSECSAFRAYLDAGKPVLNAEYRLPTSRFCLADERAGIMGARFNLELNGGVYEPCWRLGMHGAGP